MGVRVRYFRRETEGKVTSAEMKFLRLVKGCTVRDRISSAQIRLEFKIFKLQDRITEYQAKRCKHLGRRQQTHRVSSVSYTHLDVYKRQVHI